MPASLGLLSKILLASLAISIAIRQLGPRLEIAANDLNAAIAIFVPSAIVALFLGWRGWRPAPGSGIAPPLAPNSAPDADAPTAEPPQ
ncbi:MAG: hypothetical protein ACFB9N_02285 [Geitlerinemataceae cyanobacterium]